MGRFICINDGVPEITTRILREACVARSLEYFEIQARQFMFDAEDRATPGDMMFRPAVSLAAIRAEQFMYQPGVATFHKRVDGVYFSPSGGLILHEASGVPIPRTIPLSTTDRELLDSHVEALGGFPVVLKVMGSSRGVGVMKIDSSANLYSVLDYVMAQGANPMLAAYIDDAVHWRATVIGDRVAASYRNTEEDKDFRTYASQESEDYTTPPPEGLEEIAVKAVACQHLEFGGVDIVEHPSGRLYVLEVNFPCYFAQPQEVIGTDVAGMMVEHLQAKAEHLSAS